MTIQSSAAGAVKWTAYGGIFRKVRCEIGEALAVEGEETVAVGSRALASGVRRQASGENIAVDL
jgi:ribose 1,5-bisphosphokinase PhnN